MLWRDDGVFIWKIHFVCFFPLFYRPQPKIILYFIFFLFSCDVYKHAKHSLFSNNTFTLSFHTWFETMEKQFIL
jgi:hypothetical protein